MERVSDEGTVRCVPSVVKVVGGGESDGLKTEEDSFLLWEGGIGKKSMLTMVRPVSKEMVTITSAATIWPFLMTMRIPFEAVINMLLIVIHPVTYEMMATRGSIVTIIEVMQALLLFVVM